MFSIKDKWTRRGLIGAGLGSALFLRPDPPKVQGRLLGPSRAVHGLLTREPPKTMASEKRDIIIVGGGVSGLSAARTLKKAGISDFFLLEGELESGGNSRSGHDDTLRFPWGAHYLPLPDHQRMPEIIGFLQEEGIIEGFDPASGLPRYREEDLCADPQERLKIGGRWQDGIIPQFGISEREKDELKAFFDFVQELREKKDGEGRPWFSIPLDRSSPEGRFYDKQSFQAFLQDKSWTGPALTWYLNYATRDDYGLRVDQTSAWAGLQYFAARRGQAANAQTNSVLTWPEGNARLAKGLYAGVKGNVQNGHWVTRIEKRAEGWRVIAFNQEKQAYAAYDCRALIMAMPRLVAAHLLPDPNVPQYRQILQNTPWLTANMILRKLPRENHIPLSWDNVLYQGEGLGYVNAGQQELKQSRPLTAFTYYRPLDHLDGAAARVQALGKSWDDWQSSVLPDMEKMHPGISKDLLSLDIWIWGHGMAGPRVDSLWGETRVQMQREIPTLAFAHTDQAGISLFEEAFYQGYNAARRILAKS